MTRKRKNQPLPDSVEVAIIGGGIVGAASAFFLSKQGVKVALFEKGRIGGEQSGRNWGSVRAQRRPLAELPLMIESIELWQGLEQDLQSDLDWRQQGQMRLCYDTETLDWAESWVPIGRQYGLDTQVLTPKQTCDLLPNYSANGLLGALYTPTDGCAEPEKVAIAFARAAQLNGAEIFTPCAATAIETKAGQACGVQTERGQVHADTVLCAGGAWTSRLLRPLDQAHPSLWIRGSAAHSQPINIDMRKLVTWGKCACRQRADGSLLLAAAEDGYHDVMTDSFRYGLRYMKLAWRNRKLLHFGIGKPLMQSVKGEFNTFTQHRSLDPEPDSLGLGRAVAAYAAEYPSAEPLRLTRSWAGWIDYMPDELPVIGESKKIPGLFVGAGLSGNGFAMGPVVGKIFSDLISNGHSKHDLSAFDSARFD